MNAFTEKIVTTALEMDASIPSERRNLAMEILKHGMAALQGVSRPAGTPQGTPPQPNRPYLRRDEAAKYLGCSVRLVDLMKHDGDLPFHHLGRRLVVFSTRDLDKLTHNDRNPRPPLRPPYPNPPSPTA